MSFSGLTFYARFTSHARGHELRDLRNYEGGALPLLNARDRLASLSLNVSCSHSWDG